MITDLEKKIQTKEAKKEKQSASALIKQECFYFFSLLFLLLIILEIIWPNIVIAYFNLNLLIILWLISALINLTKK
jgi:hypothetical protein